MKKHSILSILSFILVPVVGLIPWTFNDLKTGPKFIISLSIVLIALVYAIIPYIGVVGIGVIKKAENSRRDKRTIIMQAKKTIFFNGITSRFDAEESGLLSGKRNLQIRILVFNPKNAGLINAYKEFKGESFQDALTWKHLKRFSAHPDTEIKVIDSFVPLVFHATDIGTNDGYIKAIHLFNGMNNSLSPRVEFIEKRKDDIYDIYKNEIDIIWNRGTHVWKSGESFPSIFEVV